MSPIIPKRLSDVQPKPLRAELRADTNLDRKSLAEPRLVIGHLVERAFALAGISKQEASYAMGYRDQGAVSRWCSGVERPLFDKLFQLAGFRVAYVVALAEQHAEFDVTTVVTIRRSA